MSDQVINVPGGKTARLLTAGKYCPEDISVYAEPVYIDIDTPDPDDSDAPILPELTNPATADDIAFGKETIDADGNKMTGAVREYDNEPLFVPITAEIAPEADGTYVVGILEESTLIRPDTPILTRIPENELGNATPGDVMEGKVFSSESGLREEGTFTIKPELTAQDALIADILTALDGKASAGVETCTVVFLGNGADTYCSVLTYTAFENGELTTKQMENPFTWSDEYGTEVAILKNVVVNTSVSFADANERAFTCDNAEYWFVAETMAGDLGFFVFNFKVFGNATITLHQT